jgi:polysaccharide export outer membrane protein
MTIPGEKRRLIMVRRLVFSLLFLVMPLGTSCVNNALPVKHLAEYQEAEEPSSPYIIGAADVLAIDVWKEPELSKQVAVRLDGKISLPLVNEVKAAGLTCKELRRNLTDKYREYVDLAEVSVTLVESHSRKIYVLGKINVPGEYELQKNMTVLQAISRAGGLAEWADTSDIRLIREIDGNEEVFTMDYNAIVSGRDLTQNVQLKPEDTIFVP